MSTTIEDDGHPLLIPPIEHEVARVERRESYTRQKAEAARSMLTGVTATKGDTDAALARD